MNYCDKIRYSIYITEVADFAVMVDNLLAQLEKRHYQLHQLPQQNLYRYKKIRHLSR